MPRVLRSSHTTTTTVVEQQQQQQSSSSTEPATVNLTASSPDDRRVQWADGTVDNEHLGKKKSKICCIYKKPRAAGESSSDSSDSDDPDQRDKNAYEKQPKYRSRRKHCNHHNHDDKKGEGKSQQPGQAKETQ